MYVINKTKWRCAIMEHQETMMEKSRTRSFRDPLVVLLIKDSANDHTPLGVIQVYGIV